MHEDGARGEGRMTTGQASGSPGSALAREERQLVWALSAGAVLFVLEAAIYVPEVFRGPAATRPYAINSVAKDVLFAVLAAAVAFDLHRRVRLLWLLILGHMVIVLLLALAIVTGDSGFAFPPPRWLAAMLPFTDPAPDLRAPVWLGGAVVATAALIWLLHRAQTVRHDLRYLWPAEHATLAAVAAAVLTEPGAAPEEIATHVDHYWAALDIGYKRRLRLAIWVVSLYPLLFARPPLATLELGARREMIRRHMLLDVAERSGIGLLRTTIQSAIRFVMQLVYVGYYRDPRSYPATGYARFSDRPGYPGPAGPPVHRLQVMPAPGPDTRRLDAEVVVIGTGAGGSLAAHRLAERGHDVLMLERGRFLSPERFVEDEADQYARLYSDGALQLSRDFSFQVLQGMCVGGSTVVNNGVCFDLPDAVLGEWNDRFDAGLPPEQIRRTLRAVRELIGAERQSDPDIADPIVRRMPSAGLRPVSANLHDCVGCGYCNLGCAYAHKLSMLTTLLPIAQADAERRRRENPDFRGRLRVLPDCEALTIGRRGRRASGVGAQLRRAGGRRQALKISADRVIVAAGAIHSSRLLMASGLGGAAVGQGLSANLGSHMTALWTDGPPVRAFAGQQMSHHVDDPAGAHMIETWFNPVMSQALVMPGWLGDHEANMRRYDRLGCLGVLVGSSRGAGNHVLRRRDLISGSEIAFTPSVGDLRRLLAGLRRAGKLMLDAGADCVMPATFRYHELRTARELASLTIGELVHDASDISVNTGHPQGGNAVCRDPRRGVVDETLRVHGMDNLHVLDASVFPTAITVNPQLTVMALARYGAEQI